MIAHKSKADHTSSHVSQSIWRSSVSLFARTDNGYDVADLASRPYSHEPTSVVPNIRDSEYLRSHPR